MCCAVYKARRIYVGGLLCRRLNRMRQNLCADVICGIYAVKFSFIAYFEVLWTDLQAN